MKRKEESQADRGEGTNEEKTEERKGPERRAGDSHDHRTGRAAGRSGLSTSTTGSPLAGGGAQVLKNDGCQSHTCP